MRNEKSFLFVISSFLFLLISCRSAPQIPETIFPETGYLPLESGASAYIIVDVTNARPVFDYLNTSLMNNKQFRDIVNRTQLAMGAIFFPEYPGDQTISGNVPSMNKLRYQLRAWGRYPSFRAKMAFGSNENWEKYRSGQSRTAYWHSARDRLSVAIDSGQAFVAAATGESPVDPIPVVTEVKIPDGFGEFSEGAVLSCWLEKPDVIVNKKLSEMGLPIELPAEQIFFCLLPDAEGHYYTANIMIQVPSPTQARALTVIFTLARGFLQEANSGGAALLASVLFSNPPVLDGRTLYIKTDALGPQEISLLFGLFLI